MVLWRLSIAVVFLLRARAQLTNFGEGVLDFGSEPGEGLAFPRKVISGQATLRGDFTEGHIGDLGIVVNGVVRSICGAGAPMLSKVLGEIRAEGSDSLRAAVVFDLLPPERALEDEDEDCLRRLILSSYGPAKPPFSDSRPEPNFRKVFAQHAAENSQTSKLDTSTWYISLGNFSCADLDTLVPMSILNEGYGNPKSSGDCGLLKAPPKAEKSGGKEEKTDFYTWKPIAPPENLTCGMFTDACVCAAASGCSWGSLPEMPNITMCQTDESEQVSCEACPLQTHCPRLPSSLCARATSPCSCAFFSEFKCRWETWDAYGRGVCVPRRGRKTTCGLCPRQSFCVTPGIVASAPTPSSAPETSAPERTAPKRSVRLPSPGARRGQPVGRHVRLTFDVRVRLTSNPAGKVLIRCRLTHAERMRQYAKDYDPADAVQPPMYKVPTSGLHVEDDTLLIDVMSVANDVVRTCTVWLDEGVVQNAFDGLPFLGSSSGAYTFELDDTTAPVVESLSPSNNAREVDEAMPAALRFSEPVRAVPDRRLRLHCEGDPAIISALAEPGVLFRGATMLLKIEGFCKSGRQLSVSIAAGSITDLAGNPFVGIPNGAYAFHVKSIKLDAFEYSTAIPREYVAVAMGSAVMLLCVCLIIWRLRSSAQARLARIQARDEQLQDATGYSPRSHRQRSRHRAVDGPTVSRQQLHDIMNKARPEDAWRMLHIAASRDEAVDADPCLASASSWSGLFAKTFASTLSFGFKKDRVRKLAAVTEDFEKPHSARQQALQAPSVRRHSPVGVRRDRPLALTAAPMRTMQPGNPMAPMEQRWATARRLAKDQLALPSAAGPAATAPLRALAAPAHSGRLAKPVDCLALQDVP